MGGMISCARSWRVLVGSRSPAEAGRPPRRLEPVAAAEKLCFERGGGRDRAGALHLAFRRAAAATRICLRNGGSLNRRPHRLRVALLRLAMLSRIVARVRDRPRCPGKGHQNHESRKQEEIPAHARYISL